uniref:BRCA1 associated ATM activator 1 n=1 Tax=Salvator merianae TaxID=96440 RepID=A0A8D0E3V0_SALMN
MDVKCSQLLPSVCVVLADPRHLVSDDTCLEKLLDWFKALTDSGPSLLLLEENPCLIELILAVLRQDEPSAAILSFILRLTGIFAASEKSFQHLQQREVVFAAFGEAGPLSSALWEDTSIRSGWVHGADSMLKHYSAFQFLCNSGALDVVFALQGDCSLFVASGATRLLARLLVLSVQSEPSRLLSAKDCDWPACARMIAARTEEALASRSAARVQHSLKLLTTLFELNQDAWTEVLWQRIAERIEPLLMEEPVPAGRSLVDLFLSMARSSAFSCHEGSLWKLADLALKNLSLAQVGPLALGLLKLKACPEAIHAQSLNVLLLPMDGIFRAAAHSSELPGVLDDPPSNSPSMESLLSSKASCLSLLCQTMAHLEETQRVGCLPLGFSHKPLLCSVVTVLQFCVGLAVPASSLGASLGRILIGSFRVQRVALGLLGALSRWAASVDDDATEQVFGILLEYLRNPDTTPTVLKAAFQATFRWFQESATSSNDMQRHKQFFRDLLPVVQKHMCSPSWEARDSALEFLSLMIKRFRATGQEWVLLELLSVEVLAFTEDLLDDPESYVRASAVAAVGQLAMITSVGTKAFDSTNIRRTKKAAVGARLLEILSTDSEGFSRRAVITVFIDWLREGHPDVLADPERFVSRVIRAVSTDLDWEVKVAGLELAEVFIAQTHGRLGFIQCPYAAESSPASRPAPLRELLHALCRVKLFEFLFGALRDCDRPVARKACVILQGVKSKLCKDSCLGEGGESDADGAGQSAETLGGATCDGMLPAGFSAETACQDPKRLLQALETTDLEGLQRSLDRSSDHLEKSPQSLLQDILSAAGNLEENEADCY